MRGKESEREKSRDAAINWNALALCLGVLAVTFGTLFWIHSYITDNTDRSIDVGRMRAIYGGLFLYETSNNELPPPDLEVLGRELNDQDWFRSINDPWPGAAHGLLPKPPLDPAFPDAAPPASFRISFTYLPMWARYGGVKVSSWQKEQMDVHLGLVACYWYGDIDRLNPDGRNSTGPVVRINMDGSVTTAQRRNKDKLTAEDLFGIR